MVKLIAQEGVSTASPDWIDFPSIGKGVMLGLAGARCPETIKASAQLAAMAGAGSVAGAAVLTIDRKGTVKIVVTGAMREMPLMSKGMVGLLNDVLDELIYPEA